MVQLEKDALWKACEPMREDGMAIADYLNQLSGILFLKACDASGKVTLHKLDDEDSLHLPEEYRWEAITNSNNNQLDTYEKAIDYLKNKDGDLAKRAFDGFNPKFNRESTFRKTLSLVEDIPGWDNYDENAEIFGDAYEFLLKKYADKAEGAGEYFTPRPLIQAMVDVVDPEADEEIIDPAAGPNGFLIEAYNHLREKTNDFEEVANLPIEDQFTSREIRPETYRLGLMNYLLHDINVGSIHALQGNSLREEKTRDKEYDVVLANPPFGSDISNKYDSRADSTIEMNFLMMMMDMLNDDGRAAIIVPEGILFDGSKEPAREELLNHYNLDVILALPEDTFQPYAGVDANVLFFERDENGTDEFWFYDARSDFENIKESNPLTYEKHLSDFVENWNSREKSEKYFKVDTEEVGSNKELHIKQYKEFKYEGYRPPKNISEDITDELQKIQESVTEMVEGSNDS